MKNITINLGMAIFALFVSMSFASATASFQVTSFSCSPSETSINSVFSCSANIQNTGDASGNLNTVTLYPDATSWLESSSYPQSYGSSVTAGETVSITFTGLRAVKSGDNGFARIMLDSVTDTYVADNNKKINVVDVVVSVSNSVSSAAMGAEITATADVLAGGNIDVSLLFTSNSGGCSIGSQVNPKSITGMTDGSSQSRTFTITQGTTGSCKYTISASATGSAGVASKTDSTQSVISCTNCPSSSSSDSSSGSSGGGGGGGGGGASSNLGELTGIRNLDLVSGEKIAFSIGNVNHTLKVMNVTPISVDLEVASTPVRFVLALGEKKEFDFNSDSVNDLEVMLKSVNTITNKAKVILTPLEGVSLIKSEGSSGSSDSSNSNVENTNDQGNKDKAGISVSPEVIKTVGISVGVIVVIVIIILIVSYFVHRNSPRQRLNRLSHRVHWHQRKGLE